MNNKAKKLLKKFLTVVEFSWNDFSNIPVNKLKQQQQLHFWWLETLFMFILNDAETFQLS